MMLQFHRDCLLNRFYTGNFNNLQIFLLHSTGKNYEDSQYDTCIQSQVNKIGCCIANLYGFILAQQPPVGQDLLIQ